MDYVTIQKTRNGFIVEIDPYITDKSASFVAKTHQEVIEILQREVFKEDKIG